MRALLLSLVGLVAAGPARAEPPEHPALQVYVEPAKFAGTPWGKLSGLEARLGVPLAEVKSLSLSVTDLTAASRKSGWVLMVEFVKPFDKAKLPGALARPGLTTEAVSPTLLSVRPAGSTGFALGALADRPFEVMLTPSALSALLPPADKLPPEFAVFKPLAEQRTLMLFGEPGPDGSMTLNLSAPRSKPEQRAALATAFDTLRQVLRTVALGENAPAATQYGLTVDPVLVALQSAFNSAKVESTDGRPRLTMTVKPDAAFAPALAGLYGVLGGDLSPTERKAVQENFKQVVLGMHVHLDGHANTFPASAAFLGKDGKPLLSWRVAILPHVGHEKLYKMFKLDEPWDSPYNLNVLRNNPMPDIYKTPGIDTPERMTRVQGFALDPTPGASEGEMLPGLGLTKGVTIAGFTDGTSNTLLVATAREPVEWTKPADIRFVPGADLKRLVHFGSDGLGELHCAFADGSARALRAVMKPETFRALVTRNGGEVVNSEDY